MRQVCFRPPRYRVGADLGGLAWVVELGQASYLSDQNQRKLGKGRTGFRPFESRQLIEGRNGYLSGASHILSTSGTCAGVLLLVSMALIPLPDFEILTPVLIIHPITRYSLSMVVPKSWNIPTTLRAVDLARVRCCDYIKDWVESRG